MAKRDYNFFCLSLSLCECVCLSDGADRETEKAHCNRTRTGTLTRTRTQMNDLLSVPETTKPVVDGVVVESPRTSKETVKWFCALRRPWCASEYQTNQLIVVGVGPLHVDRDGPPSCSKRPLTTH